MPGKTAFLGTFLLLIKTSLFAQVSLGVEGGLSYNVYRTDITNRAATSLAGQAGGSIAVAIHYRILSWLDLVAAPNFVQKGYSMNRTDSLAGEYDRHSNVYLQLPIGVSLIHDWARLRVGLDLGVYTGYWASGRVKGSTADIFGSTAANGSEQFPLTGYNQVYSFNAQRDNRWEEGWWTGLALYYRLTGAWWLTAGARYYEALTSQEKAPVNAVPAYNETWIFSIGGAWSLPQTKSRR